VNEFDISNLTPEMKREFLEIPNLPVMMEKEKRPLMIAATSTSASLVQCFIGERKKTKYPTFL